VLATEVNPSGKSLQWRASAKGITVVGIAVPEHTVGLCVPLVNTIVEARLRVTVPDIVFLYKV
jgi:hypothetical protein